MPLVWGMNRTQCSKQNFCIITIHNSFCRQEKLFKITLSSAKGNDFSTFL